MDIVDMPTKPSRILSLDVFRGMAVAAMILVNNPGDFQHVYPALEHAAWNGCTPTDLIFPFFLFIVGVSIAYAFGTRRSDPALRSSLIRSVVKRSLILFSLGLFLALFPRFDFSQVRIPGVLQRIALVYLFSSLIYLNVGTRVQIALILILLVGYYLVLIGLPVPGYGRPSLEPESNMGAYLDRLMLTPHHLYQASKTWDPEGLLSTLPAIATALCGIQAGVWLKRDPLNPSVKIIGLIGAGILLSSLGYGWSFFFPLNKSLWSSSFVLFTAGLASLILAILFWVIDVKGWRTWTMPFLVYGVNAITVFFLSGLVARILNLIHIQTAEHSFISLKKYLFIHLFAPYFSPINASLAGAIALIFLWMAILWGMYKAHVLIKI